MSHLLIHLLKEGVTKAVLENRSTDSTIDNVLEFILRDKILMLEAIIDTYNSPTFGIQITSLILQLKAELQNLKS